MLHIQRKDLNKNPPFWKNVLKTATLMGFTGMLCCIAPMVLFMIGLMGGIYAITFADFFYKQDGSAGAGAWILRIIALAIGLGGLIIYRKKQNQCSIKPVRKKINLVLFAIATLLLGLGIFFTFERLSSWYFDKYIVPAKQEELRKK